MAKIQIIINQFGLPSGVPGVSRDDLYVGGPVTLTNLDNTGANKFKWEFVSVPVENLMNSSPVISSSVLSGINTNTAIFTPDIPGTYIIKLTINNRIIGTIGAAVISTHTDASNNNGYLIDASAGNVTLTLPLMPSEGNQVGICDIYNKATTNIITVSGNGSNIEGYGSDLTLDVDGARFILVYSDPTRGWEITSEIGTTGGASSPDVVHPTDIDDGYLFQRNGVSVTGVEIAVGGTGPLLRNDGDGSALTGVAAEFPVGTQQLTTIWSDAFSQSRDAAALGAAGYTLNTPGTSTIAEDGTSLKITAEAGTSRNWYGGTVDAVNIQYPTILTHARRVLILASVKHPGTNSTGVTMILQWPSSGLPWYRVSHAQDGGVHNRSVLYDTTDDYLVNDGGAEGWLGFYLTDDYAYGVSLIRAWALGEPGLVDLQWLVSGGRLLNRNRLSPFSVRLAAISYGAFPGVQAEIGALKIYRVD